MDCSRQGTISEVNRVEQSEEALKQELSAPSTEVQRLDSTPKRKRKRPNLEEVRKVTSALRKHNRTPIRKRPTKRAVWITNPLYILHESDHNLITSPSGWLNDKVITASQKVLHQQFPDVEGLQPPTLEQIKGLQSHVRGFVQILNVRKNHWVLVSNLGCERNEVHVYDTMYSSLLSSTMDTIARLAYCPSPKLTIKMVEVSIQTNLSNCGILSVAMAFDVLSARAPCVARYDPKLIRNHLCECLKNCHFTAFPVLGEKSSSIKFKFSKEVELFCVCRMPEHPREDMAECEECAGWFHKTCEDIPDGVFDDDQPWKCHTCVYLN